MRADSVTTRPQGMRALLWLKSREWLGPSRDSSRLFLLGGAAVVWWVLLLVGAVLAVRHHRIDPLFLKDVAAGVWPLFALVPLLGGGGGEVVAAQRLAAYPLTPRAVFGAAWAAVLIDVPYLVALPLVIGLQTGLDGAAGFVAAVAFAAGGSATGQLGAWVASLALTGRKRSGLAALLLTGSLVGLLTAAPHLLGSAARFSQDLPSGWLHSSASAHGLAYWGWIAALIAPVPLAVIFGPVLARTALDREARAGGAGALRWGDPGWGSRGSIVRMLAVADLRSMTRALGAQVALAGVLAVPALTKMPGVDFAQVSLPAMGTVAAIAAATVLGLNAFAFSAGGASLLLSLPARSIDVIVARAIAVGVCLFAGQAAVTAAGAFALHSKPSAVVSAIVLAVARSIVLAGMSLAWSVRLPSASDYDSLRARIAAPRSIISFGITAAFVSYLISQGAHDIRGGAGVVVMLIVAAAGGSLFTRVAATDLAGAGTERVVTAVVV